MKNIADKFTNNVWLIALIMIKDVYEIIGDVIQLLKNGKTMNIDYFDFITRLVMAIALMLVLRQYQEMKRYQKLTQLFNQVMFEDFNRLNNIISYDKEKIIRETKAKLLTKANIEFKGVLDRDKIEKMVDDYFGYKSDNNSII